MGLSIINKPQITKLVDPRNLFPLKIFHGYIAHYYHSVIELRQPNENISKLLGRQCCGHRGIDADLSKLLNFCRQGRRGTSKASCLIVEPILPSTGDDMLLHQVIPEVVKASNLELCLPYFLLENLFI